MKPSRQVARDIPVFAVVPPNVLLLDVAGPMEVLRKANLEQQSVRFVTTYVGPASVVGSSIGLSVAGIAPLPERLPDGAFVLLSGSVAVPMATSAAAVGDVAGLEQEIVVWLKRVVRPSIAVASICSGALLAARAGLLDDKACTTHHAAIAELKRLAPLARVEENRLFVIDGERLTSAGVTSGVDLMLHVVAATDPPSPLQSPAISSSTCGGAPPTRSSRRGSRGEIISTRRSTAPRTRSRPSRRAHGRCRAPRVWREPVRAICRVCSINTPACR